MFVQQSDITDFTINVIHIQTMNIEIYNDNLKHSHNLMSNWNF